MQFSTKLILFASLYLASCMPKEDAIKPFPRGDVKEVKLDMGADKADIVFFSLSENKVIARANPRDWDLYFDDQVIRINYLRSIRIAEYDDSFEQRLDTSGLKFSSLQDGRYGSMWELEIGKKYVLDMGSDPILGQHLGYYKLRFSSKQDIHFNMLDSIAEQSTTLITSEHYYSLLNKEYTDLPKEEEYDLVFGKYTHYFDAENLDYIVYGAILGDVNAKTTEVIFEDISEITTDTLSLNSQKDEIGYAWKAYNLDKGAYEINTAMNYVIVNKAGLRFKLRFTNFYNDMGVSGHPTFEFKLF